MTRAPDPKKVYDQDDPEVVLVGGSLVSPALASEAMKYVSVVDFADKALAKLWGAICALIEAGTSPDQIDVFSVASKLAGNAKQQRTVAKFASGLQDGIPRYTSLVNAAQRVRRRATMRVALDGMRALASPIKETLETPGADLSDLEERLSKLAVDVAARSDSVNERTVYMDRAHEVSEYFDQLSSGPLTANVPTGIPALDVRLGGGFRPGQLHTIAGVSGFGKTGLASQVADHAASNGRRAILFSMEVDPVDVYIRDVEREAQRSRWDLRSKFHIEREKAQVALVEAQARILSRASGKVVYGEPVSVETIRQVVLTEQLRGGPVSLVVVDHAQVAKASDNDKKQMPRYLEVKEVAVALRRLARRLNLAVVLTSQMNPPPKGEKPSMFLIRESKDVVNSSDVVILIWHEREEMAGGDIGYTQSWLIIDKIRAGVTCKIPVNYRGDIFKFEGKTFEAQGWEDQHS